MTTETVKQAINDSVVASVEQQTVMLVESLPAPEPFQILKPNLQMPQLERPQTDLDPSAIFQINSSVKTYNPERKDVDQCQAALDRYGDHSWRDKISGKP